MSEPRTLDEFVGQGQIKRELNAMLTVGSDASILLRGFSGSGKTTLARLYAEHRGDYAYREVPRDLENLSDVKTHIIDEIHLLKNAEVLYPRFENTTFVLCTTEREDLPEPLVNRCIEFAMLPYEEEQMALILLERAFREEIDIDIGSLRILASRSRGVPRVGVKLLRRVNVLAKADAKELTPRYVANSLNQMQIYENGLTNEDLTYLSILAETNSPVSLKTLSAVLNRSQDFVKQTVENYLLYLRYILITPRGRILTTKGKEFVKTTKEE